MQSASRALASAKSTGEPLPVVGALGELVRAYDVVPRRGQILMIAGQPGSQKSGLALWLTKEWGLETLYFSADMAQHTAMLRLAASVTGHTKHTVEQGLESGAEDYYLSAVSGLPLVFCFDSTPTLEDLAEEIDAYVELYDDYPAIIVVDNAINVQLDHDNEWSALRIILLELHTIARVTGAAVILLHHMAEGQGLDPTKPAPRKALHGKVSQLPEIILSIAVDPHEGSLKVVPVKNRDGKSDPNASTFVRLRADMERTRFFPWTGMRQAWTPPPSYYEDDD